MGAVADHLWQSTWFVLVASLLALLVRRDFARVRYWIWLAASLKFLVPFAFLGWIGHHFILQLDDKPALLPVVQQATAPLSGATAFIGDAGYARYILIAVWMMGSAFVLQHWVRGWLHSRMLVKTSSPCDIDAPVAVRCSGRLAEPSVVGIVNPVVLLPHRTLKRLTPAQIDAVIAHEVCHVRRRDNLAAALQMLAQALFWFHPLIWWVGNRLVLEREHACDEGAVQDGHDPTTYAHTLLQVCRHSIASRHLCAASAAGGDLNARIRAIVSGEAEPIAWRRVVAAAALLTCMALPVALGMKIVATSELRLSAGARSIQRSSANEPGFVVVQEDYVYASNVSMRELISRVFSVESRQIRGYGRSLDYPRYDIELRATQGDLTDARRLVTDALKQQFNLELIVR